MMFGLYLCLLLLLLLSRKIESSKLIVGPAPLCFYFDKSRDVPVTFTYSFPEGLSKVNLVDFYMYYGDKINEELIVMKKVLSANGKIDYETDNDGYYYYCLSKADISKMPHMHHNATHISTNNDEMVVVDLEVMFGRTMAHEAHALKKDAKRLDLVNMNVRVLNDMIELALIEADYQKDKEVEHHDATVDMNQSMVWWPVIQIGVLVILAFFQVQHLQFFFKSTKLI